MNFLSRIRVSRLAFALALLVGVAACSDDGADATGVAPTVAGPAGGTFTLASGVTVTVPAGALAQSIQLSVTVNENGGGVADEHRLGPVYDFAPAGTSFATPVAVTIPGAQGERPLVVTRDANGELVVLDNGSVDGSSARGGLYRLGPVWVSDRGNVVEDLDVSLPVEKLVVGSDESLSVMALNLAGDAISLEGATFSSSNPDVVSVSPDGTVSGRNIGTATVTVSLRGATRSVEIEVAAGGPTRLELLPAELVIARRDSAQMVVRAYDAAGNDADLPEGILFSTNDGNILRVSPRGVVFSVNSGTADVIATSSIEATVLTATATVTVPAPIPSDLRVMPRNPSVGMGKTRALVAQTLDEFGEPIAAEGSPSVTWTSLDTDVATIDAAGTVTGVALGTARIVATSSDANAGADTVRLAVGTGDAVALTFVRQPEGAPSTGSALLVQPIVRVVDSFGNDVETQGVTVRAVLASGSGTLAGTTSVVTDAKGIATFTNLGIAGIGNYTLSFEADGLESVTSSLIRSLDPMVLEFNLSTAGTIELPFFRSDNPDLRYSITVDWGDGSVESFTYTDGQPVRHTFGAEGANHVVRISGVATNFGNPAGWTGNTRLKRVLSWGWLDFKSFEGAFAGATALTAVPSELPSSVHTLDSMFDGASSFNQNLSSWDVTNVISMTRLFARATDFNNGCASANPACGLEWGPETGNVTDMSGMFEDASSFNQDLSEWDLSNVLSVQAMFRNATNFNNGCSAVAPSPSAAIAAGGCPLEWGVGTRKIHDMAAMFQNADAFNQDISSWDVTRVLSMNSMFDDAASFNNGCDGSTDCPLAWSRTPSALENSAFMFRNADSFNQDISNWDMSSVIFMTGMFQYNDAFNNGCSTTDYDCPMEWYRSTKNAVFMDRVFEEADAFNQDISSWDVGKVTTMHRMFALADRYNNGCAPGEYDCALDWPAPGPVSVTDMSEMFSAYDVSALDYTGTVAFNQDVSSWSVSSVTTMFRMFHYSQAFNNGCAAGQYDCALDWGTTTSKVTTMQEMFESTGVFNQDVSSWNVSSVTTMEEMFGEAPAFNNGCGSDVFTCALDWGSTSKVENLSEMFDDAHVFNQDVSSWDVSSVTNMYQMFHHAYRFNNGCSSTGWAESEGGWTRVDDTEDTSCPLDWGSNTSSVETMYEMFNHARSFNQDVSGWDVSSVTTMYEMFNYAYAFNNGCEDDEYDCQLSWASTTSNVETMHEMFYYALSFNQDVSGWDVSSVTNMEEMFRDAGSFNNGCANVDYSCELDWGPNTRNVTTMRYMFHDADRFDQNVSGWDMISVVDLYGMFYDNDDFNNGCPDGFASGAQSCPLNWETSTKNVETMALMFFGADDFNQHVGDWDVSRVTTMYSMFEGTDRFNNGCLPGDTSCPIQWTSTGSTGGGSLTGRVTDMEQMFKDAVEFNQDIGHWDVSAVTTMHEMFYGAHVFNRYIGDWDVRRVTDMADMFHHAWAFNQNIGGWNVFRVTDMANMFHNAFSFNQDIGGWDVSAVTDMSFMFEDADDFNRYIGGWDVRAVTDMQWMFAHTDEFNQDLSRWCVPLIGSEPTGFDTNANEWYPRDGWGDDWAGRGAGFNSGFPAFTWNPNYDWGRPRFGCWTP